MNRKKYFKQRRYEGSTDWDIFVYDQGVLYLVAANVHGKYGPRIVRLLNAEERKHKR